MNSFVKGRLAIPAETLVGSRVYSTDLHPSLADPTQLDESVATAARALKIKALTKGTVTLNAAFLMTPIAVLLFQRHNSIFAGDAFLPAFRTDRQNLASLVETSPEDFAQFGINDAQLSDHTAYLERAVQRVMPWDPVPVAGQYRSAVISGLMNEDSLVSRELRTLEFGRADRERLIQEIESLSLLESYPLRELIERAPSGNVRNVLKGYAAACYHLVGTSVVRCEAGTDLSPLSLFKSADTLLAARDGSSRQLSDDALFLRAFLGHALDVVQSAVFPEAIIDAMPFEDVHRLSAALRQQGFQSKYEAVLEQCAQNVLNSVKEDALEQLDAGAVAAAAKDVAAEFDRYFDEELESYLFREQELARQEALESATDLSLHAAEMLGDAVSGIVPGAGLVVAATKATKLVTLSTKAVDAAVSASVTRLRPAALQDAKLRKNEEIRALIDKVSSGRKKKTELLDATALLADVYQIRTRRA